MSITSPTGAVHLFRNPSKYEWRNYQLRTICGVAFTDHKSKPLAGWTKWHSLKNTNKRKPCKRCAK